MLGPGTVTALQALGQGRACSNNTAWSRAVEGAKRAAPTWALDISLWKRTDRGWDGTWIQQGP